MLKCSALFNCYTLAAPACKGACSEKHILCCSHTLAGLLELADISLPEDFEAEEQEVVISGLQNRPHKVSMQDDHETNLDRGPAGLPCVDLVLLAVRL